MRTGYACFTVLAAIVVGAGCSLVTDLNGFTSRADDANSSPDAESSPGGDASGAVPPPPLDGSTSPPTDAGDPREAGAPLSLCSGTHFFCTDFDTRVLTSDWDLVAAGDGTVDRNTGAAKSMPYSLEMTHPIGNPGGTPVVAKTLPAAGIGGLKCSFSYRRDDVDDVGVIVVLMVDFNTSGSEHLFAEIKDGKTQGRVYLAATAPDGIVTDDFPIVPTFAPSPGAWAKVEWTLDLRAKRSTLASDGKLLDQRPFGTFTPANLTTVKLSLGLGNFKAPTSPWRVRFDDFVCDAVP